MSDLPGTDFPIAARSLATKVALQAVSVCELPFMAERQLENKTSSWDFRYLLHDGLRGAVLSVRIMDL
ncbi:hypothetical protein [Pseudoxanthomonas sp. UTMC 1351]|uniref:hypothetical protein n=1 Tax=Pseudoxanthomonas sp. UTMC 1351 TaxID=2695853 RepID=UPI0034CF6B76